MADEPLQQAEAALADLAEQFERWRRSRTARQERIPPGLWDRAVALSLIHIYRPRPMRERILCSWKRDRSSRAAWRMPICRH